MKNNFVPYLSGIRLPLPTLLLDGISPGSVGHCLTKGSEAILRGRSLTAPGLRGKQSRRGEFALSPPSERLQASRSSPALGFLVCLMRGGNRTWMTLSAQRRARQLGRSGAATRLGAASPRGGDPARRSGELPLRACGSGAPPRPSASRGRSALCQPRARAQLLAGRAPRWPRSGRRWGPEAGAGAGGAARGPAGAASAAAGTPRSLS